MCKLLSTHFPKHRLILSDFYKLPDTIEGINGPVVQTRYRGNMVPCSTFRVQPGWFDIFFPTNFELLKKIYTHTRKTAASAGGSYDSEEPVVLTQGEFVTKYADLSKTKTRSGENPMSMLYENNKFILT
ncbi:hypothetical protein AX774_g1190 [Zancudomyces culisetae]|uniref:Protein arginine methyltransferase NDUFAF7 n=1 Tax=Zancudomyces culisetae TaxID=1213189 RepID=A0A1R1PW93_ZANCU|nr:hypothetical protein AX774_g1190 [Zancudomyces culisetae]|eukprot:OMH85265.1 hypothetical protein AX774_g1190 [Zancudomyces culisetae]